MGGARASLFLQSVTRTISMVYRSCSHMTVQNTLCLDEVLEIEPATEGTIPALARRDRARSCVPAGAT